MRRLLLAAALAALLFVPAAQAWTWPAGGAVLEPFVFDPAHPYAAGQHRGVVIGAEPGARVLAPAAGTVTFAGTVPSSGKSVTITTADGLAVTLTELGSLSVAKNATVAEGDTVGLAADSGDGDFAQPYVHLGVRVAADPQGYLDPLAFLPARTVAAPPAVLPPAPNAQAPVAAPEPASSPRPDPVPPPVLPPAAPPVAEPVPAAAAPAGQPVPVQAQASADPAPTAAAAAEEPPASTALAPAAQSDAPVPAAQDAGEPEHASPRQPAAARSTPPRAAIEALGTAVTGDPARARRARPAASAAHAAVDSTDDVRAADARLRPRASSDLTVVPRTDRRAVHPVVLAEAVRSPLRERPGGSWRWIAGTLALVLLGAAAAAAFGTRGRGNAVPTMDAHALLRHHPDLLRQRPAAHRSLLHDHRGRHPRAPSPPARRGDVLPHGGRRARDEGLARR